MCLTEDPARTVRHRMTVDYTSTWGSEPSPGLGTCQKGLKITKPQSDKREIKEGGHAKACSSHTFFLVFGTQEMTPLKNPVITCRC